jgi:hypothetical protein
VRGLSELHHFLWLEGNAASNTDELASASLAFRLPDRQMASSLAASTVGFFDVVSGLRILGVGALAGATLRVLVQTKC